MSDMSYQMAVVSCCGSINIILLKSTIVFSCKFICFSAVKID